MPKISALFFDVGGVLLSNAWDRAQRLHALQNFNLDEVEFDDRHDMLASSFERGKISLDEYLDRTVFYRPRAFTRKAFRDFLFSLSQPDREALDLARALAKSGKYLMATINNESTELNLYRIESFGLRALFSLFVSSCFVGLRKPEEGIYRLALQITQQPPEQCCFIDDRPLNLEAAQRLGMQVIRKENVAQLRGELEKLGVSS
ncbi:MAG: HAD family phosphatase [Acidobacteriia bacterium]|nr:HAD family phosphatase [Terriglobia bacterium]